MNQEQLAQLVEWLEMEIVRLNDEARIYFQAGSFMVGDTFGAFSQSEAFMCKRVLEKIEELTK